MTKEKIPMEEKELNELEEQNEVEENSEEVPEVTNEAKEETKEEQVEQKNIAQPQHFDYSDENLKKVEDNRIEFYTNYKKQNIFKWIFSFIAIGLLVFAFIGVPNLTGENQTLRLSLMVVIAGVSLGLMLGYSLVSKKLFNKKARTYFDTIYQSLNAYHFDNEGFEIIPSDTSRQLEKIEFDESYLFKDVIRVNSRNYVEFKYNDIKMMVVDAAGQVAQDKRFRPIFVGKYLVAPANYDGEQIIVYLKGDKRGIPPTNIDDIKMVFDDEKMSIYTNEPKWKEALNSKVKNAIKLLKTDKTLIDVSISLRKGSVYVCLGYDDDLMTLPLENPFNPHPNEHYKKDLLNAVKFIETLNK